MVPLQSPPPEPPEPPSVYCTPSQSRATTPSPLARQSRPTTPSPLACIFMSKPQQQQLTPSVKPSPLSKFSLSRQTKNPMISDALALTPDFSYQHMRNKTRDQLLLKEHRHTNPAIWCSAIICLIFSLILIFSGIATLIIYLVVKPRYPVFDANRASLNVIYFDSPGHFNGDFTFLANFSNPNKKLDVRFEHAVLDLYFDNSLIASQSIKPFNQRRKQTGVVMVHFISSLVYLPPNHAMELQKQVLSNKVMYNVRGTFRVRMSLGLIHFTYWLHGSCELEMSSPPSGYLMARRCKTKT